MYLFNLGLLLGFIILRFKNGGKVCSGDYKKKSDENQVYLNY